MPPPFPRGLNVQIAAQLPNSFPHSSNADARLAGRIELRLLFGRHAFAKAQPIELASWGKHGVGIGAKRCAAQPYVNA
jgi:hypothetical protein